MSEELEVKVEETKEVEQTVEEVQISPVETTARDQGWVSKEEWVEQGRDESEWRPAKEFVDRGELYKSIHSTKRELKQTQAALTALQKHHQFVFEKAQKQALDELRREKRQALKNEDIQKVVEVDEKLEELQAQHEEERKAFEKEQAIAQSQTQGVHPDFVVWQEQNTWYTTDEELREYADFKGIKYAQKNPGVPPQEVLSYVAREVRKQFPEKFGTRKAAPNAVISVNKTNSKSRQTKLDVELTETERDIMKDLVASGVMTESQYIAELKKVKDR